MELLKQIRLFLTKKHNSDKIFIEAFGSPGVGKSFICNKIKKNYESEYGSILFHSIDNYNNYFLLRTLKKLIIIIRYLFFSPSLIKLVLQFLNKFENMEVKNKIKLIFNFLFVLSIIKKQKNISLLDQGIFQSIWSCFYYNNNFKGCIPKNSELKVIIVKIIDRLCLQNLVIVDIIAEDSIILARLNNRKIRGTSALNNPSNSNLERGNFATILVRSLIHEMAQDTKKIKVFSIQN